ncbi:response regulator [Salinimicrobium catena]|uniref:tetratricopeptide repeat-containing hybrid sensor histidine kinase/response regulator n=1 Tax=Salinimicrobium catena TaxID=390640 RepID=UPI002FE4AFCE
MRNNYFLSVIGFLLCLSLYPQTTLKAYKDSIQQLKKAANEAYDTYDYNKSIEYSTDIIELAAPKNDYYNLQKGYNLLGIAYEVLKDTSRARENYEKALRYAELTKNDTLLLGSYNNLGNILSSNPETIEQGLDYYERAIEIASKSLSLKDAITPVVNIAWTHLENGEHSKASPFLKKAWQLSSQESDKNLQSNLLTLMGMYYSGIDEFADSREHFRQSIEMAKKDSLLVEASFAYEEYSKMLVKNGLFEEAYSALKEHQEYEELLFQKEKNHQREVVYGRFQTEEYKKDLAAAQREQQYKDEVLAKTRQITLIMIFSLAGLFLFLIFLFRNNRIRKKLIGELREKNDELTAAKEEAERLSLLKTRFFSTVSHELRTPLYGVVGLTSLLLEENENEKQKEDLKSLKFSADYLLALINDVLQMNKMESNLVHLENGNFDMQELFKGIVKSFETTRNHNNNSIELQIDENIPLSLIGDSMRLSQVMMNLVGNAVKFTQNGKVWIKAQLKDCGERGCVIQFEVGDTGPGIPKNKQQEIFEEFSQLQSNNYNYQGTGLGLPIVKKLLQLFGSDIHLESEEGKGSVFSFEIEFEKGNEEVHTPVKKVTGEFVDQQVKRALIVDDNRINQVVTRRILEQRDFECLVAGSGEEALAILKTESLDVVLMDVNMPGMNGMETTQEVRKFNANIPIIALTAVEVGEMREEILSAGMNDIINKPYNIPEFFSTIFRNLLQPVA